MFEFWWYLQWLLERSLVQGLIASALVMVFVSLVTAIDGRLDDE